MFTFYLCHCILQHFCPKAKNALMFPKIDKISATILLSAYFNAFAYIAHVYFSLMYPLLLVM